MPPENPADRRRGHAVAQLGQLALQSLVSPAWVLGGQAQKERAALRQNGRASGSSPPSGKERPLAPNKPAVPAKEGFRTHGKDRPGGAGQALAERRQHQAVKRAPGHSLLRSAEHTDLVSEQNDLEA